jgi:hypothetical protein
MTTRMEGSRETGDRGVFKSLPILTGFKFQVSSFKSGILLKPETWNLNPPHGRLVFGIFGGP